jgi:glycosyltransferase involved in cell wall biosynthesis
MVESGADMTTRSRKKKLHIGFVSTRFAGTDGVSLETNKWAEVLTGLGYDCFYFTGISDKPVEVSSVVPEASFLHPEIQNINVTAFSKTLRPPDLTRQIMMMKDLLKQELYKFISRFDLNLLIVENALSIPMNIPLALALTELIAETGFFTISHNHDFFWERKRFLVNCVWDYLNMSFPPHLPSIHHVVINSSASNQLSLRTGISSLLVPNVMDFDHPPAASDEYSRDIRSALGFKDEEFFILQPTRVVQRKGIEHAIDLVSLMNLPARLIISHASGDEGYDYEKYLRGYSERAKVKTSFVTDIIKENRGFTEDGKKIYTLYDIYPFADLVTYPSDIEGFGNAFLEAVYFSRPLVVNSYSIFNTDIKPKGFQVIEFDGFINQHTVNTTRDLLLDKDRAAEMAAFNYSLAKRYYSYNMLQRRLETLLAEFFGE